MSQTGPEVTALVARALAGGTSSACVFARRAGAQVIPVDVGVLDMPPCPGLLRRRVVNGTGKAEIVKKAFFGPVTPEVPASILQMHPDFTLVGDEEALSLI